MSIFVSEFVSVMVKLVVWIKLDTSSELQRFYVKTLLKLRERKKERKQALKSRNLKSFLEFSKVKLIMPFAVTLFFRYSYIA